MEYQISIIVPVYNVEKYIERCAKSLFEQTIDNIEYIFVNDCTTDRSIEVLNNVIDKYPNRRFSISIINHKTNLGLPSTRNSGLNLAKGNYVAFCDSDDWADINMYKDMCDLAIKEDSDIVWCDYYQEHTTSGNVINQNFSCNKDKLIKGLLSNSIKWSVWNKIFHKKLFIDNNIMFVDRSNLGEDMSTCIRLFAVSNSFRYLNKPYYHYWKDNETSLTKNISNLRIQELLNNIEIVLQFFKKKHLEEKYFKELNWFKIINLSHIIHIESIAVFKEWNSIYPNSNKYILSCPNISVKRKIFLAVLNSGSVHLFKSYSLIRVVYRNMSQIFS